MKLEVGMYVRFDDGTIVKLIDIKRYKTKDDIYYFDEELDWNEDRSCNDNKIYEHQFEYLGEIKAGFEPMDVVKVGDYVNGEYVIKIFDDCKMVKTIDYYYTNDAIRTIVTKEQFESMEYKVGV